ncbi:profilin [Tuber brumale]|nr:profilin [Tuber brumale]
MSWQAYVDSTLLGSKNVNAAAIFSAAGDSVWATSVGFAVKPEEIKVLATAFGDGTKVPELPSPGFHIGGAKYITIKCEEKKIYGKQGKTGIVCARTTQAILVAYYGEDIQPGQAANTVEALAEYLRGVGY